MTSFQETPPFVAIIGRPNVGKSSLFNRLIKRQIAITSEQSGTTRDRLFHHTDFNQKPAVLVDTSGLTFDQTDQLENDMRKQVQMAINQADLILFVIDGQSQPTADDHTIAQLLRKSTKAIIFIANKCDNPNNLNYLSSWSELGFGAPQPISVIHNLGLEKLIRNIATKLPKPPAQTANTDKHPKTLKLAFIGRPNAGKSTFINAILKQERVISSPLQGTTRDAIDVQFEHQSHPITLIDTAGIRRRGKIEPGLEKYSLLRALRSIERSDITCLILDYQVGIRAQDLHICQYAIEASKGLILVVNKIDLMENKEEDRNRFTRLIKHKFDFLSWAPVIFASALNNKNITPILDLALQIKQERSKQVDHQQLIAFLQDAYHKHYPALVGRKRPLFYDIKQLNKPTPTFQLIVNDNKILHFSYQRYLENRFREQFGFTGTAIDFIYQNATPKQIKQLRPL